MNGEGRLLLDHLIRLGEQQSMLDQDDMDELRAVFTLILSRSPHVLDMLDRLSYGPPAQMSAEDVARTGILLKNSGTTVSNFIGKLIDSSARLVEILDDPVDESEVVAGLSIAWTVMSILEWSSHDSQHIYRYSAEAERKAIASAVRSMDSYRKTGDP